MSHCRHTWAQMARAMRLGFRSFRYGSCPACAWEFSLRTPDWIDKAITKEGS